jgi:hypothetical protein
MTHPDTMASERLWAIIGYKVIEGEKPVKVIEGVELFKFTQVTK